MTFLPSRTLPPDLVACLERADEVMEKKPGLARDLLLDKAAELSMSDPCLVPPVPRGGARIALHRFSCSIAGLHTCAVPGAIT